MLDLMTIDFFVAKTWRNKSCLRGEILTLNTEYFRGNILNTYIYILCLFFLLVSAFRRCCKKKTMPNIETPLTRD